jgi:hypothetical protein
MTEYYLIEQVRGNNTIWQKITIEEDDSGNISIINKEEETNPNSVYMYKDEKGGNMYRVKIGKTKNPNTRNFSTENPGLDRLTIISEDLITENQLHTIFVDIRIENNREWFYASKSLLNWADQHEQKRKHIAELINEEMVNSDIVDDIYRHTYHQLKEKLQYKNIQIPDTPNLTENWNKIYGSFNNTAITFNYLSSSKTFRLQFEWRTSYVQFNPTFESFSIIDNQHVSGSLRIHDTTGVKKKIMLEYPIDTENIVDILDHDLHQLIKLNQYCSNIN